MKVFEVGALEPLFSELKQQGYRLIGPTLRSGAIEYDELDSPNDLPAGWTERQDGGTYRLEQRHDQARFGYTVGSRSWKNYLYPSVVRLWQARRQGQSFQVETEQDNPPRYAFIGVRSCDLHAIAIQDRVLLAGKYADPVYRARREGILVVAINCGQAGGTCFCVSMNTGPKATFGYDLALTEVIEGDRHYFTVEVGSERGAQVMEAVPHREAQASEEKAAQDVVERTAGQMGRQMDTRDIKEVLYQNYEHPRWNDVASRCLTCTNCTMVCPTCFCSTVEDHTDLTGEYAQRHRRWDSCFTLDHSYLHGGSVRTTNRARYRQWMTHKLATWIDQFGTSGCVGCGRCITWCPVGIDITEEMRAIRENSKPPSQEGER